MVQSLIPSQIALKLTAQHDYRTPTMFWSTLLLITWSVSPHSAGSVPQFDPLSDDMINYINNVAHTTWTAGRSNRFETVEQADQLLGTLLSPNLDDKLPVKKFDRKDFMEDLPKHFDPRVKWPKCKSLAHIRDQSSCGSCWAMGAVEAMTDRICIHSNATDQTELSGRDLLSCCESCGFGCGGGSMYGAWQYWKKEGIVSGGDYHNQVGCQPYPFAPCSHHCNGTYPPCPKKLWPTPTCLKECQRGSGLNYTKDKYFGASIYSIKAKEKAIMWELMQNGPIEAGFTVYDDFLVYKKGIYHHVAGRSRGGHAVKLLGWGEDKRVPYWLLANSWNRDWGEHGYFRMLRRKNECGIQTNCIAGLPRLKRK